MASSSSSVTRSTSEQPDILPTQNTRSDKTSATKVPTREENGTSRPEILCKLVAALLVLFFVVFHLVRVLRDGSDTCPQMLQYGRWRGSMWQPYGCMMHQYTSSEVRTCLKNHPVAFVGDSRSRELYYEFVETVSLNPARNLGKKHIDLLYRDETENISVAFYWQPEVNDSMKEVFDQWIKEPMSRPHLVVAGAGTWTIKRQGLGPEMAYGRNLTQLRRSMEILSQINKEERTEMNRPRVPPPFPRSPVIVWRQQEPVVESKLDDSRKMITNEKIDFLNAVASEVFVGNTSVKLLWASYLAAKERPNESDDGLHYDMKITNLELHLIMNMYCNRYMRVSDGTCCVPEPRATQLQQNTIAAFVTCIALFVIMFACRRIWPAEKTGAGGAEPTTPGGQASSSLRWIYSDKMYVVMKSLAKLGMIMFYFYLADRTDFFLKEQKVYSHLALFLALLVFVALGAWTWTPTQQTVVLNRDQTDEWKGWMQLVILVYHYIGASKVLSIYVFIRLLVASYLFMSGYGHFSYFWKKGDFGLIRFCSVMTRMNIFVVVLCLVMGRSYQFYYFVPLVSFWFVVVYATMAVFPRVTAASIQDNYKQYTYIWLKFVCLFGGIYMLWSSPMICEKLFSQWAIRELFIDDHDSVREWRFRSWLDRYIVLYGMLFAFAYCTAKLLHLFDDSTKRRLFVGSSSVVAMCLSAVALLGYAIQAFTCSSKISCNETHSTASCIPLTAFILLRNIPGSLRTKFSKFYAWIGVISLELFVGQYHIWLAHDTKGVLVLIPESPLLNAVVTTFIFVCICHEVHKVTTVLANALVVKDFTIMLRRLAIFSIVLLIIWWHKTRRPLKPKLV